MATKIFDAEALVAGTTLVSDPIDDVGNLVIDFEISGILPETSSLTCRLTGKEDATGTYKPITLGENEKAIKFQRSANGSFRQKIQGVDANFSQLEVDVPDEVTAGSITAWVTITANPNIAL